MDIGEYRRQLYQQLEDTASDAAAAWTLDLDAAIALIRDPAADSGQRVAAFEASVIELSKRHDLIELAIAVVRDVSSPPPVRRAALAALRTASFRMATFAPMRPAYLDALRAIVDAGDPLLRLEAIEVLAQEKDEYVQRRLMEGLQDQAAALVPPEHAVEFLGYDVHAEHLPLLQTLARQGASAVVRQRAVSLLGADHSSQQLLQDVLTDRNEDVDVRTASAAALKTLAPAAFARIAADIAVNEQEDDSLRAASVTALDHFSEPGTAAEDPSLVDRLRVLQTLGSDELQRAVKHFVDKREK